MEPAKQQDGAAAAAATGTNSTGAGAAAAAVDAAAPVHVPAAYYHRPSKPAFIALIPDEKCLAHAISWAKLEASASMLRLHGFQGSASPTEHWQAGLALMRSVRSLCHARAPLMAHQMDRTLNVFFDRDYFLTLLTHAPFTAEAVEYWRDTQHYLLHQSERVFQANSRSDQLRAHRPVQRKWQQLYRWLMLLHLGSLMSPFHPRCVVKLESDTSTPAAAAAASTSALTAQHNKKLDTVYATMMAHLTKGDAEEHADPTDRAACAATVRAVFEEAMHAFNTGQ